MAKEIAVFTGPDGSSAALGEQGMVSVFRRAQGSWELNREKELSMGKAKGMREMRLKMAEILQFLDGCSIFVARSATGIPFFELEKAGCRVWEFTGMPADFLEHVWEQEEAERTAPKTQSVPIIPVPEEKAPGEYFISIRAIQGKSAEITSKQILQQFIRKGDFRSLVIICSHIPPWLEVESMSGRIAFETERPGMNEFRIKIMNKAVDG